MVKDNSSSRGPSRKGRSFLPEANSGDSPPYAPFDPAIQRQPTHEEFSELVRSFDALDTPEKLAQWLRHLFSTDEIARAYDVFRVSMKLIENERSSDTDQKPESMHRERLKRVIRSLQFSREAADFVYDDYHSSRDQPRAVE